MTALALTDRQKAAVSVALHYSDGSSADLGSDYNYSFSDPAVAVLVNGAVYGVAGGSTVLHVWHGAFAADVDVTVTATPPDPVPDGITVSLGSPEPK